MAATVAGGASRGTSASTAWTSAPNRTPPAAIPSGRGIASTRTSPDVMLPVLAGSRCFVREALQNGGRFCELGGAGADGDDAVRGATALLHRRLAGDLQPRNASSPASTTPGAASLAISSSRRRPNVGCRSRSSRAGSHQVTAYGSSPSKPWMPGRTLVNGIVSARSSVVSWPKPAAHRSRLASRRRSLGRVQIAAFSGSTQPGHGRSPVAHTTSRSRARVAAT